MTARDDPHPRELVTRVLEGNWTETRLRAAHALWEQVSRDPMVLEELRDFDLMRHALRAGAAELPERTVPHPSPLLRASFRGSRWSGLIAALLVLGGVTVALLTWGEDPPDPVLTMNRHQAEVARQVFEQARAAFGDTIGWVALSPEISEMGFADTSTRVPSAVGEPLGIRLGLRRTGHAPVAVDLSMVPGSRARMQLPTPTAGATLWLAVQTGTRPEEVSVQLQLKRDQRVVASVVGYIGRPGEVAWLGTLVSPDGPIELHAQVRPRSGSSSTPPSGAL